MHRFFISPDFIDGDAITFPEDAARQIARVLRSRPGDQVIVLDDTGREHVVTLEAVSASQVTGRVMSKHESAGEPAVALTLYQGVLKADRFEFVLQKGTELGVSRFVPVICERSVSREAERSNSRTSRWQRIIREAAEQSRRGKLPALEDAIAFREACDRIDSPAIIPWEQESAAGLKSVLRKWQSGGLKISSLGILIGPEGGFSEAEVRYAAERGIAPVTLGRRILRAETAGIAVAVAVMYELGEMGG